MQSVLHRVTTAAKELQTRLREAITKEPTVNRRHRPAATVLILAVSLFGVAGCAASNAVKHTQKSPTPLSCAAYSHLDNARRAAAANATSAPIPNGLVAYTATDAAPLTAEGYLDEACAAGSAGDLIDSLASDAAQSYPSCADFLKLDATVQAKWSTSFWTEFGDSVPTDSDETRALAAGCLTTTVAGPTIIDGARNVASFLQGDTNPADFEAYLDGHKVPPPPPATPVDQLHWTDTTSLGYTTQSAVTWGGIQRGSSSTKHPNQSTFVLGSACGFDPSKDAYVAGVWTVTNTTKGQSQLLSSTMTVDQSAGSLLEPELELSFSDGPSCGHASLRTFGMVVSNDEIASGKSISVPFFVILKNYYSPKFPSGDVADSKNVTLVQSIGGGASSALN